MYIIFSGPFLSQITLDKSMFGGANHTQRPSHHKPPDINNPNTDNLNTSGEDKGKHALYDMGLDARKPVFGDLQTKKVQTSLRIRYKRILEFCMPKSSFSVI